MLGAAQLRVAQCRRLARQTIEFVKTRLDGFRGTVRRHEKTRMPLLQRRDMARELGFGSGNLTADLLALGPLLLHDLGVFGMFSFGPGSKFFPAHPPA